jgi:hypothetical protein
LRLGRIQVNQDCTVDNDAHDVKGAMKQAQKSD